MNQEKVTEPLPQSQAPTSAHMKHWQAMARPPVTALKEIKGGRLKGMTDVNPQWRYQAMTEQFGPCGEGWKYTIDKLWTEPGAQGEVLAFAQVSVLTKDTAGPNALHRWSDPIVGIGGNHLITKESGGLHSNDECWKMAVTDALSVALKMLGVAADVYAGRWDGAKYNDAPKVEKQKPALKGPAGGAPVAALNRATESTGTSTADFDLHWTALIAAADEGKTKYDATWDAMPAAFKNYVMQHKKDERAALVARAKVKP